MKVSKGAVTAGTWLELAERRPNKTMKEIILTKGMVALVDDADAEMVGALPWYAAERKGRRTAYAAHRGRGKRKSLYMHRLIMGVSDPDVQIDHIDHNGLNNQRSNLRICDRKGNQRHVRKAIDKTSSKYKGVYWSKASKKFVAQIVTCGKAKYLGGFNSEEDAAREYDRLAVELFGEFAALNFPKECDHVDQ